MKQTITLIVLFIGLNFYAQNTFEKGYIITLNGQKINCLIGEEDWYLNPKIIKYKTDTESKVHSISVKNIKELSIPNSILLERHEVNIDRSSSDMKRLSNTRISNFKKESLLLKVIVDGKARLLRYNIKNMNYYFYMVDEKIVALEYKIYKDSKGRILNNLNYRKILKDNLTCKKQKLNSNIKYHEKKLINYIVNYNTCHNSKSIVYKDKIVEGKFNIRFKVSATSAKSNNPFRINSSFNNKLVTKIGAEFEYVLPINKRKWSLFIEPTYQSYKDSFEVVLTSVVTTSYHIDYSSFEIPLGLRHYIYLNKSKLFINAGINFETVQNNELYKDALVSFNGSITKNREETLTIEPSPSYFLGFGYEFNDKFSAELRYNTSKQLSKPLLNNTNFSSTSIKIGYNIL